jgi:membrane protein
MNIATFFRLLRVAAVRCFYDNCFEVAKSAAYSSILSFFPGMMVVASLVFSRNVARVVDEISVALGRVLPPEAYKVAYLYLTAQGKRAQGLLAGAWVISIWSASNVMVSLMEGFRVTYRIPHGRPWIKGRAVALALLILAGLPLLFATLLFLFGQQIENWLAAHFQEGSWLVALAGRLSRWTIALATSTGVIAVLYHVGPNRRQLWRFVWPGALLATVLWLGVTALFAWYVQHVARYNDLYGSISTAVVLLIWMYLLNLVVMFGCEFNALYEEKTTER